MRVAAIILPPYNSEQFSQATEKRYEEKTGARRGEGFRVRREARKESENEREARTDTEGKGRQHS